MKKSLMPIFVVFIAACLAFSVGNAYAGEAFDYWTPERMAAALPFPEVEASAEESDVAPMHDETDDFYPPPYQRFTWQGKYTKYPVSTVAKIFVTLDVAGLGNPLDLACSGAVINTGGGFGQNDVVATAAHCLNNGLPGARNAYATNVFVCPSYNANGVNPHVGCWEAHNQLVTPAWLPPVLNLLSKWEQDVGCIVTKNHNTDGTLGHIGDAVGMLDVDYDRPYWNPRFPYPFDQDGYPPVVYFNFSYPANPPFPGHHLITSVGPGWYTLDYGGIPSALSTVKFMGNDATSGADGGPWIVGYEHATAGYPDIDGRDRTDPLAFPAMPALAGINSHRRPLGAILCPPSSFFCDQEIASPQITTFFTKPLFDQCQGVANTN